MLLAIGLTLGAGLFVYASDHSEANGLCPISVMSKAACPAKSGLLSLLLAISFLFAVFFNKKIFASLKPKKQYYGHRITFSSLYQLKFSDWLTLHEKRDPSLFLGY